MERFCWHICRNCDCKIRQESSSFERQFVLGGLATAGIVTIYLLSGKEMQTYFEDSIGKMLDWKKRGQIYEVTFRTLYNLKVKNLICAGRRCTSVNETMWDIMRVIPCCAVIGPAARTATALTDDFSRLMQNTFKTY